MQQNLALSTPTTAQNMPLPTELNPTDLTLTSSPPSTSLCAGSSQAVLLHTTSLQPKQSLSTLQLQLTLDYRRQCLYLTEQVMSTLGLQRVKQKQLPYIGTVKVELSTLVLLIKMGHLSYSPSPI